MSVCTEIAIAIAAAPAARELLDEHEPGREVAVAAAPRRGVVEAEEAELAAPAEQRVGEVPGRLPLVDVRAHLGRRRTGGPPRAAPRARRRRWRGAVARHGRTHAVTSRCRRRRLSASCPGPSSSAASRRERPAQAVARRARGHRGAAARSSRTRPRTPASGRWWRRRRSPTPRRTRCPPPRRRAGPAPRRARADRSASSSASRTTLLDRMAAELLGQLTPSSPCREPPRRPRRHRRGRGDHPARPQGDPRGRGLRRRRRDRPGRRSDRARPRPRARPRDPRHQDAGARRPHRGRARSRASGWPRC